VLIYGSERWTPTGSDEETLSVWKGKLLPRIICQCVRIYSGTYNTELYETDIVETIIWEHFLGQAMLSESWTALLLENYTPKTNGWNRA
jgi:hypothetical protein